jgi:hypothetical protein
LGRVQQRLANGCLADFALATHAIADFYAHSLYGYFAGVRPDGTLPPFDPDTGLSGSIQPDYQFLKDEPRPDNTDDAETFVQRWRGKIISGQWWRWYTTYPKALRHELAAHRCLPDHDRLAVDSPNLDPERGHALYPIAADYENQFKLRRAAAVEHIQKVYAAWRKP